MKTKRHFVLKIASYFRAEWFSMTFIVLSGLFYNVGLLAAPQFEGKLAQRLADILGGSETAAAMAMPVLAYIAGTLAVQAARFVKRFYVRRFANNINRRMKGILYANLLRRSRTELKKEGAGYLITKAVSDVDDCIEGMRKFTTEIFDTGVALLGYAVMLFIYDWRLALLSLLFTPISYFCWTRSQQTLTQKQKLECRKHFVVLLQGVPCFPFLIAFTKISAAESQKSRRMMIRNPTSMQKT